ncbi:MULTISPECIES: hypothetical protein [Mesorhizobium]|uniref:hypothetical protein n=1 Tax=Mesorhizobium TaxID=68287 RepID=UPI0007A94B02|nr:MULTISPECIES: hypothetical protein [Mesorhizobium]AMX93736.1 hypothetical protein A4R28_11790 [Mesorhizobium ciceri]MDF3208437.1 hypothetical protein [Mesorhizobium sp. LMG15046]MDF3228992.1 hypothetical protein [Mesorhizobium sp. DSM 30133]RUU22110.1 hypothetical protein EOC84_03095 [Mesorhizobium sp. Primo-B]RUU37980.1 hypothetical protein EOC83_17120 [Mesorhizobium sp. Primo-A]
MSSAAIMELFDSQTRRDRRKRGKLVIEQKPIHPLFKDITGRKFNRLTAASYAGRMGSDHAFVFACECGNEIITKGYLVSTEVTRSCGCLLVDKNREIRTTHGLSHTREWRIWAGMKNRCLNPRVKRFSDYGGRGIKVCDRWLHGDGERGGFECFITDLGMRLSSKHSIERKENDGNYEPGNVAWATRPEQAKNTRVVRRIEFRGETKTSHEWASAVGISSNEINKRLRRGWSVERALTQPMRERT